jgi:hypothetical protein
MKQSVYKKVHRDVLLEWIYDTNNNITEPFQILNNNKDQVNSYIGGNLTSNSFGNQLFPVDIVKNKWAKINTTTYNFLQLTNYNSQGPIRHDTIKLHFPSNYNFAEYQGLLLKIYTYDFDKKKLVSLSNFFYDKNDSTQSGLIDSITPPLLYEDRLWDKEIYLDIPSVNFVSLQRSSGLPTPGSLNDVLTNGVGLSLTSPIFIDFHFITSISQIGSIKSYLVTTPFTIQVAQTEELQELQLYAQESSNGDYFEFYPTYNGSFQDFQTWIDQSWTINKMYLTEYLITLFEQNVKGKTTRFIIDEDFSEIIEYRPIIKYSTTIASIDIEMRLIDKVDGTILTRKAVYGLKPDQISKYSLNIKKINIQNTEKPKIYVKKKVELAEVDSLTRNNLQEVVIDVNTPSLISLNNISCYSENDINPKLEETLLNYRALGEVKVIINPFDNILKFSLAIKSTDSLNFIDLTDCQDLKINFKSDKLNLEFGLYGLEQSNLKNGGCIFRIPQSSFIDLKKIWMEKNNLFYITTNNKGTRTVIYSGLFLPSDSKEATDIFDTTTQISGQIINSTIIDDPSNRVETAIVTRRQVRVDK